MRILLAIILLCAAVACEAQQTFDLKQLTWSPGLINPAGTTYIVRYGTNSVTNSGAWLYGVNTASNSTPVLSNLVVGNTYYFAVLAVAPGGVSPYSKELVYTATNQPEPVTNAPATNAVPSAPLNLTITNAQK